MTQPFRPTPLPNTDAGDAGDAGDAISRAGASQPSGLQRRALLGYGAAASLGPALLPPALLGACASTGGLAEPPIEVLYMRSAPIAEARDYVGFKPSTTILAAGTFARPNPANPAGSDWGYKLPVDIIFERDVEVVLRDGTRMYIDIYRPAAAAGRLPAIMTWAPYGKSRTQLPAQALRNNGVDPMKLSGLQRFEGPDPAWWCGKGYAVISPDPRGSYMSEGDILQWGPQSVRDGYDVIEWVASRDWSNGKVGMTGNSWLGISQYFIASGRPPALAAIAPWESLRDSYRDNTARGGIPDAQFATITLSSLVGPNRTEDAEAMIARYPLMNSYWESKIADLGKVRVPAYMVASWTNSLHTPGTFEAWEEIGSADKWLRVHNSHEWPDYYLYQDDLLRFFDHYLRGIDNGWQTTPRVRLSIFDEGFTDVVDRPEREFPLARTVYRPLYLNAANAALTGERAAQASSVGYQSDDDAGEALFTHVFAADTELTGYLKLRLWLQADGADDMDVFVQVRKLDADGQPLLFNDRIARTLFPTTLGPQGRHRVSLRAQDPARSKPYRPYYTYRTRQLLRAGEIVPVEFDLSPTGTLYRAGQRLQLSVAGFRQGPKIFPSVAPQAKRVNKGRHIVHAGAGYDSHLLLPVAS